MTNPFPSVCLTDFTGKFHPDELGKVALALLAQINRDLSLPAPFGYGLSGFVHASPTPLPHEWVLGLFTHPDQPGALGYHDETLSGLPLMKVFPFIDASSPWSTIASHELVECLVDPNLCRAAQSPVDGRFWALEVCDAVEQDTYEIDGVKVSNFVLPTYYETPRSRRGLRYDQMGLVKQPLELRPGGYAQYYDLGHGGWHQVLADRQSGYRTAIESSRPARRQRGPIANTIREAP